MGNGFFTDTYQPESILVSAAATVMGFTLGVEIGQMAWNLAEDIHAGY
jgi:hypothetical protein